MIKIKLFEQKLIRSFWDEKEQQWYFSVIDTIPTYKNFAHIGVCHSQFEIMTHAKLSKIIGDKPKNGVQILKNNFYF